LLELGPRGPPVGTRQTQWRECLLWPNRATPGQTLSWRQDVQGRSAGRLPQVICGDRGLARASSARTFMHHCEMPAVKLRAVGNPRTAALGAQVVSSRRAYARHLSSRDGQESWIRGVGKAGAFCADKWALEPAASMAVAGTARFRVLSHLRKRTR